MFCVHPPNHEVFWRGFYQLITLQRSKYRMAKGVCGAPGRRALKRPVFLGTNPCFIDIPGVGAESWHGPCTT
jgi:hypothetical protein